MKHHEFEPQLRRYEALLAGPGIERGLVGPRERDRLWERHIVNCAVVAQETDLVPESSTVVDVGSGAGLPGLVWAIMRPDLQVVLLESLLRRTNFLDEAVADLGLTDRVRVVRSRAEEAEGITAQVVTARAVAPLPRLLGWLRPLTAPGGQLVLLKGRTAADEVEAAAATARRLGLGPAELIELAAGEDEPPTTVVRYRLTSGD